MIIKIALSLLLISLVLFFSDDALIEIGIPKAPEVVTQLGLISLLVAFLILIINGMFSILTLITQSLLSYFSANARIHRRLLFIQAKQLELKQLFLLRAQQVNYFHEDHKSKLLNQDNQRQIKALIEIIDKDLVILKYQLSKHDYLKLVQTRKQLINHQNLNGLLELQQTLAKHASE